MQRLLDYNDVDNFKNMSLTIIKPLMDQLNKQFFVYLETVINNSDTTNSFDNYIALNEIMSKSTGLNDLYRNVESTINNFFESTESSIFRDYMIYLKLKEEFNQCIISMKQDFCKVFYPKIDTTLITDTMDDEYIINEWLSMNDNMYSIRIFMKEMENLGYRPFYCLSRDIDYNDPNMIICLFTIKCFPVVGVSSSNDNLIMVNRNKSIRKIIDSNSLKRKFICLGDDDNDNNKTQPMDEYKYSSSQKNIITRKCTLCNEIKDISFFISNKKSKSSSKYSNTFCSICMNKNNIVLGEERESNINSDESVSLEEKENRLDDDITNKKSCEDCKVLFDIEEYTINIYTTDTDGQIKYTPRSRKYCKSCYGKRIKAGITRKNISTISEKMT
jgi:hypothetical protein